MADYLSAGPMDSDGEEAPKTYEVTDTGNSSMKVVVRVRPESEAELRSSCHCVVKVLDEHVLVFDPAGNSTANSKDNKPFAAISSPGVSRFFGGRRLRPLLSKKHKDLRFAFDHVFDETASQSAVFHNTAHSVVEGVLDGINCSIFAYGATGAGKTHTMLGHPEDPGVIFLTMMELYRRIDSLKNTKTCRVNVSYCEVYNETIRDLLEPSGPLSLREDSHKGLVVSGLSSHAPQTADEILGMLERGNNNRTQHPTEANATSSRSHAVFQVFVEQQPRTAGLTTQMTQGKMSLIDLAGSERATMTSNRGARLREGANINRSLLALGNCINALASSKGKAGYVPYRDSKLTRLLKDSLGGNCRTVMVANVSPSALSYEDTYNTLKYADRAKQIKTTLVRNVLQVDYHLTKYKTIIQDLRKEISELKVKVEKSTPKCETFDSTEADRLCELVVSVYGERGRLRKHMADLDAKEREALLKVCRKERDLNRIELLSANEMKSSKIHARLEALRQHVTDIQRQKQTVNEYLYSNNESVGRVQGVVNAACREEKGGTAVQRLLEAVTEARKLEVEHGHQWKQTKHLLKYIKNQEREIVKTERVLCMALSLVRSQQCLLKSANVSTHTIQDNMDSLTHLADGDKGVAWADQTRISTNDLQDVNVSSFSLTQQQLFDCFLEHSSPRMRGKPRDSPQLYHPTSLSILTATTSRGEGQFRPYRGEGQGSDGTLTPRFSSLQDLSRLNTPTPIGGHPPHSSSTGRLATPTHNRHPVTPPHSSTVTVRASHTISSHTSPYRNADSSSVSGVMVTTDVCISSADLSDGDNLSDGSTSGVGSYTTTTSEPPQCDLDYDQLERKHLSIDMDSRPAFTLTKTQPPTPASPASTLTKTQPPTPASPAFTLTKTQPPTPASPAIKTQPPTPASQSLYGYRPMATPFTSTKTQDRHSVGVALSTRARLGAVSGFKLPNKPSGSVGVKSSEGVAISKIPDTPLGGVAGSKASDKPIGGVVCRLTERRPSVGVPQPYSMFQPFHQPARRTQSTSHLPPTGSLPSHTPTPPPAQPPLSSQHSNSTDSGIGQVTSLPRPQGSLIPNRPLANGFMVRSSPSSSGYYNNSHYYTSRNNRLNMFEDNFVSPKQQGKDHITSPTGHVTSPTGHIKAPIGALKYQSPATRVTAMPNPYVRAPSHQRPPHVYQSINIPGPTLTTSRQSSPTSCEQASTTGPHRTSQPSATGPHRISKPSATGPHRTSQPSATGSPATQSSAGNTLNSTFTVQVDMSRGPAHNLDPPDSTKGTTEPEKSDKRGTVPSQRGRGIFSRNKSPSKIPSYLRMTKSVESKKVQRVDNKENLGQAPSNSSSSLIKRFNLNRSRDRINTSSSSSSSTRSSGLSTRFNSTPQLAW